MLQFGMESINMLSYIGLRSHLNRSSIKTNNLNNKSDSLHKN